MSFNLVTKRARAVARARALRPIGACLIALGAFACAAESSTTPESPETPDGPPDDFGGLGGGGGTDAAPVEPSCGNEVCEQGEDCESCPRDCGQCPKCDLAPSCTGAVAVPTLTEHMEGWDNGDRSVYVCGEGLGVPPSQTTCMDPQLRLRIRQVRILKGSTSENVYCVVNADDGYHSEILVTPLQPVASSDTVVYAPSSATFWGQTDLYRSISNLTITYQCFQNSDTQRYREVFDRIEQGAIEAGAAAGPYGWAFGIGSVAAGIVSAALGDGADKLQVSVQQTIDAGALLELTNGRTWEIRGADVGGVFGIGAYEWMVEIESWGCADARTKVQ